MCIVALLAHMTAAADCENELVNGWGGEWTPFIMGSPEDPSGLDIEILDAVVKKAGCRWRNTASVIPWSRHLRSVESGTVDIAPAASRTEERATYAYFTLPYRTEYVAVYVLEEHYDKFAALRLDQLSTLDFRLGTVRGDVYGEQMGEFVKQLEHNLQIVDSNTQNLEKLQLNRIDGYIGHPPHDTIVLKRKTLPANVVMLPNSIAPTGSVHFMLSKKGVSKATFAALNKALAALEQDGTIDAIKAKYAQEFNIGSSVAALKLSVKKPKN